MTGKRTTSKALPGYWDRDLATTAWLNYANGRYPDALRGFSVIVAKHPEAGLRLDRAMVYVQVGRYDSATADVEAILAAMRQADAKVLVHRYESKAFFEYALGLLYAAQGKFDDAAQAQARALEEDLSFYSAHDALARVASLRMDRDAALREHGLAAELAGDDPVMHLHYGQALLGAKRDSEAVVELRKVVALDPWYADGHFALAMALEARGDASGATTEYGSYVLLAPRRDAQRIADARERMNRAH